MTSISNPAKSLLRAQIKEKLKLMTHDDRQKQSKNIVEKLISHPIYLNSTRISIYLSTDMEVSTMGILNNMFETNKQVFVPTYNMESMKMLKIFDINDYNQLPMTKWNIKQPHFDDLHRENCMTSGKLLDLVIVPGVAFTPNGKRLGHGKGFYDKFFREYFLTHPNRVDTKLIGLAFKEQMLNEEDIPMENHDFPIDIVLTSN